MDQCDAAEGIRLRFGLEAAFDYSVGEKLLHFAEAAARSPDFARELPRFVTVEARLPEDLKLTLRSACK